MASTRPAPDHNDRVRVIHLAAWTDVYRGFAFEDTRPDLDDAHVPGSASEGVAWLIRSQDAFVECVGRMSSDEVFEQIPTHWGSGVAVSVISGLLNEHVHHLAEIGALRDIRRGHALNLPPAALGEPPGWWSG